MITTIRGKEIYYEEFKNVDAPAVLYIHGGPGGVGGLDFAKYQAESLSKICHLVIPDQRGVWRSEGIGTEENITLEDIIEDFEELRKKLSIDKWSLLSHSFGGYLSILYADMYPDSVDKLIMENPSFNFALSEKSIAEKGIQIIKDQGRDKEARDYKKSLEAAVSYQEVGAVLGKIAMDLGEDGSKVMWYGSDGDVVENLAKTSKNGRDNWIKSTATRQKLLGDGRLYHSAFEGVHKINKPCLLLKGIEDPITTSDLIKELEEYVPGTIKAEFTESGHYIHIEEPVKYARVTESFILKKNI